MNYPEYNLIYFQIFKYWELDTEIAVLTHIKQYSSLKIWAGIFLYTNQFVIKAI